jgi:GNAT superfamily N-acetyltransferase
VPCFFVKAGWRGRGVARALLEAAVKAVRRRGGRIVEGYPVKLAPGARQAPVFVYTGTEGMFREAGFETVARRPRGKQRVRRTLSARR